jgi:hypothetical protein
MAVVVIDGIVHRTAIIPNVKLSGLPSDTTSKLRFNAMVIEHLDQGAAFLFSRTLKTKGV